MVNSSAWRCVLGRKAESIFRGEQEQHCTACEQRGGVMRVVVVVACVLALLCQPGYCWVHRYAPARETSRVLLLQAGKSKRASKRASLVEQEALEDKADLVQLSEETVDRLDKAVVSFDAMMSKHSFRVPNQRQERTARKRSPLFSRSMRSSAVDLDPFAAPKTERSVNQAMLAQRMELPVFKHRDELIRKIETNPVTVVIGPTGSGKSTQIPQFLLEEFFEKSTRAAAGGVICTQPRRIAAASLATRVARERGERIGERVGYVVGEGKIMGRDTRLAFMTQGILLRMLEENPTLKGVKYLLLDEVHERSLETDFLLPILRDIVNKRKDFRLVIMSATVHADDFFNYFNSSSKVEIQGRSFPVDRYFYEDVLQLTNASMPTSGAHLIVQQHNSSRSDTVKLATKMELENYTIMKQLIEHIHTTEGDGAILVFLPGVYEIELMKEQIQNSSIAPQLAIRCLYGAMPLEEQHQVYETPPPGKRKVILSTNVAESSITVNDAVFVIDSGMRKATGIHEKTKGTSLNIEWVSQASATQRAGRAGRVRPGKCWHLIPTAIWEQLPAFDTPEINRTPLEELCLKVHGLGLAPRRVNGTAEFLSTVMSPPRLDVVEHAVAYLKEMGALDANERITDLGSCLAAVPLHPNLARAVLYGLLFKCLDPVLTLAIFLRDRSPFVLPFPDRVGSLLVQQLLAEDHPSDHLAAWNAFVQYKQAIKNKDVSEFCRQNFIAPSRMRTAHTKGRILRALTDQGLIAQGSNLTEENANSGNWGVVKAALLAGLYPAVAELRVGRRRTRVKSQLFSGMISTTSFNSERRDWPHRWIFYTDHFVYNGSHFVSGVTNVSPLSMLLVGGFGATAPKLKRLALRCSNTTTTHGQEWVVKLQDLVKMRTDSRLAPLLQRARRALYFSFKMLVERNSMLHEKPVRKLLDAACLAFQESDEKRTMPILGATNGSVAEIQEPLAELEGTMDILHIRTPSGIPT